MNPTPPFWPAPTKPPECQGCPRARSGRGFVPGHGPLGAALMAVGEQPGENEVIEGHEFVGRTGRVVDDGLGGKEGRAGTYTTNVRKCLGPKGESAAVRAASIAHCCKAFLQREIDVIRPKEVLAIGADAAYVLSGRGDVSVVSGSVYTRAEAEAMQGLGGAAGDVEETVEEEA